MRFCLAVVAVILPDVAHGAAGLSFDLDRDSGDLTRLDSEIGGRRERWLGGPVSLRIRNEVTGVAAAPGTATTTREADAAVVRRDCRALSLRFDERWTPGRNRLTWDLEFSGDAARVGHEVTLEFPLLKPDRNVFTPTERGVMSVAAYPDYTPAPYAGVGYGSGRTYVLPLVSVLGPESDSALTIALPADTDIPALQVEWTAGKTLRLRLAHRAMGGGKPSHLRLLFYAHLADYRCALKAYSDDFPRYFEPGLPRGPYEGAFWYHHIHDHPDFGEMERQDVRFIWSSFWFTYLGEYLPPESEWFPYTYARMWALHQKMTDAEIQAFIREQHEHHIGVFAYFNVTEYGGLGGERGDSAAADRVLRGPLADALVKDQSGQPIGSWEGAMAVNPGRRTSLFPVLQEQLRRHLTRLPELDGFCIDRLDWASAYDWGHSDGETMVGDRAAENLASPVAEAVQEVCRQAHEAGKRVYVNQFYRIEVLRDVDGYCHECDYVRGLGYLSPFRPASAWHQQKPYQDDLLQFEAQLKERLQFALFPQMIAHEFPISQQGANAKAADLLETYAPLFSPLHGPRQALLPHCVAVTGPNEANLFVNQDRRTGSSLSYVAPVTSRVRFRSRGGGPSETVTLTLRVPDAAELKWATVYSADGPPYPAGVGARPGGVTVTLTRHCTASMVVIGKGAAPNLAPAATPPLGDHSAPALSPALGEIKAVTLKLVGTHVGAAGTLSVFLDGRKLGEATNGVSLLNVGPALPETAPEVRLATGDEGTWFAVERAQLVAKQADGKGYYVADWTPDSGEAAGTPSDTRLRLRWCAPRELPVVTARFDGRDTTTAGGWPRKYGSLAAWIPDVTPAGPQKGYSLDLGHGQSCLWAPASDDPRVPEASSGPRRSTCWFADQTVSFAVTPPHAKPYRLAVYVLDWDRNKRAMEVALSGDLGALDAQQATIEETDRGVYLKWTVTGPVTVEVRKTAGYNAVISGVFVDPA